jgi:hypothetical protein
MCSNCSKEFKQGRVCEACSKLICNDHEVDSCVFCGGNLKLTHIEVEKAGELDVNWLIIDGTRQAGIVGFDFLPSYFMTIWSNIRLADSQLKVIMFPSKKTSIEYEKELYLKNGLTYQEKVIIERSRYSIFCLNKRKSYYLLLNQSSLNERTAVFLTILNLKLLQKLRKDKTISRKRQAEIINSVGIILFGYNKKMGIPFVSADEVVRTLIMNLLNNIQQDYFEGTTLQELIEKKSYANDVGDYLKYKIETLFDTMDFEARFLILEVFQNLEKMLHINILLASISSNASLAQFLKNCFYSKYNVFKKKYAELPDLIRAVDYVSNSQSQISFSTYDEFARSISMIIKVAFSEIEARYVSLAEGVDLLRLSDYYLHGLESGKLVLAPNIGTIYGYIELLKKVFKKEGIYPEVRIIAGYALEHTLLSWLMIDHALSLFQEYGNCTEELARLIETNLPEILKMNGSMGDFHGSPLTYEDAAQKLLTASKVARSFGDKEKEKEFASLSEAMATKYDLLAINVAVWWSDFVSTQNFSYLDKIHENMKNWNESKISGMNFLAVPIGLLIEAILHKDKIDQNIDLAQEKLLESTSIGATLQIYAKSSLRTTEGFYHIFEVFRELLKYQGRIENINRAYNSALVLSEVLEPTDPLLIISLKTRIVNHILNYNLDEAANLCKKLSAYEDSEKYIGQFLKMCSEWIEINLDKEKRRFIFKERFQYKGEDVWICILQSFIFRSMEEDLNLNIAGSKALVFVEGITDSLVFNEFKDKILPKEKIIFFDTEGFTNYEYYVESKVVKELKIPIYLIFDGDTREEKKYKTINIMKRVSIESNHIYTLQQNTIENYLLNSKAITRAFPQKALSEKEIEDFFEKTKNKKNKKRVLQLLFQQFNIGSYSKENAKQIASRFERSEVNSELKVLLTKIMELENV